MLEKLSNLSTSVLYFTNFSSALGNILIALLGKMVTVPSLLYSLHIRLWLCCTTNMKCRKGNFPKELVRDDMLELGTKAKKMKNLILFLRSHKSDQHCR